MRIIDDITVAIMIIKHGSNVTVFFFITVFIRYLKINHIMKGHRFVCVFVCFPLLVASLLRSS